MAALAHRINCGGLNMEIMTKRWWFGAECCWHDWIFGASILSFPGSFSIRVGIGPFSMWACKGI